MTPSIDTTPINSRTDWMHQRVPARLDRTENKFPGVPERHSVTAPVLPNDLILIGWLEGIAADRDDAMTALFNAYDALEALRDGAPHTVRIYATDFENMQLIELRPMSKVIPFDNAAVSHGQVGRKQRYRLLWRALAGGSS